MDWQRLLKQRWLIFAAACGVLLLSLGAIWPSHNPSPSAMSTFDANDSSSTNVTVNATDGPTSTSPTSAVEIEEYDETQLESILSKIAGIHAVTVMVSVDSSGTLKLAKNNSASRSTSGRSNSTTSETDQIWSGGTTSEPYVVGSSLPQVVGVLVTVNADNFFTAKSEIVESITNVLDVPAYKISVEPQKGD